ncbi:hypothetical protein CRYUN_Cryun35bG0073400 [Craigia yunnanensis]
MTYKISEHMEANDKTQNVEGQNVLLVIDNIFNFTQANSEVSVLLGRIPSAIGYQPIGVINLAGDEHCNTTCCVQNGLQNYKNLQDIIVSLEMDELSEDDDLTVAHTYKIQRFLSKFFHVAKVSLVLLN